MPRAIEDPILAYTAAEGEINQIQWGATQPDWIGEGYSNSQVNLHNFQFVSYLQPFVTTRIWRSCEFKKSQDSEYDKG